jgi:type I restriction enzyme R subunit
MSNFNFLTEWQNIQENAIKAESLVNADPRASCFYSRYTLERMVQWMYEFDTWLTKSSYDNTLNNLINQSDFRDMLERPVFPKIKVVQKSGNEAVHSARKVSKVDSTQAIKELHHILYWFYRTYTSAGEAVSNQVFDLTKVPQTIQIDANLVLSSAKKLKELQKQLAERDTTLQKALEDERAQNAVLRQQLEEARKQRVFFKAFNAKVATTSADSHDYNEAQTRKFIIDQYGISMLQTLKSIK